MPRLAILPGRQNGPVYRLKPQKAASKGDRELASWRRPQKRSATSCCEWPKGRCWCRCLAAYSACRAISPPTNAWRPVAVLTTASCPLHLNTIRHGIPRDTYDLPRLGPCWQGHARCPRSLRNDSFSSQNYDFSTGLLLTASQGF